MGPNSTGFLLYVTRSVHCENLLEPVASPFNGSEPAFIGRFAGAHHAQRAAWQLAGPINRSRSPGPRCQGRKRLGPSMLLDQRIVGMAVGQTYPKWLPRWSQRLKPAVFWWPNFNPHPDGDAGRPGDQPSDWIHLPKRQAKCVQQHRATLQPRGLRPSAVRLKTKCPRGTAQIEEGRKRRYPTVYAS